MRKSVLADWLLVVVAMLVCVCAAKAQDQKVDDPKVGQTTYVNKTFLPKPLSDKQKMEVKDALLAQANAQHEVDQAQIAYTQANAKLDVAKQKLATLVQAVFKENGADFTKDTLVQETLEWQAKPAQNPPSEKKK